MDLSWFDYELPPEQIAQAPSPERAASRLMLLDRAGRRPLEHRRFAELTDLLAPGTVLALNETRVVPARFLGRRETGGKVEVLLVRPLEGRSWEAIVRAGGSLQPPDEVLDLEEGGARVRLLAQTAPGRYRVEFADGEEPLEVAERCGRMPLPPYVRRAATAADRESYQTVYARVPGAIAAPTAGLHFTPDLLAALEARGVVLARLVLHVGPGTFFPVRCERVEDHVMEEERYEVPAATAALLDAARAEGRPVVACGTTCVRALESYARSGERVGATDLFVYPPFEFRLVDGLITNFHLPRSTLLMLVSAFAGREAVLRAYAEAVAAGYRFYSYGDAMFIRPGA